MVHFKHSATLVKSLTNANIQFDFKVNCSIIFDSYLCLLTKVYPDVDHYFDQDPRTYKDFLSSQRRFFQGCLGGRVNKERKAFVHEEEHD